MVHKRKPGPTSDVPGSLSYLSRDMTGSVGKGRREPCELGWSRENARTANQCKTFNESTLSRSQMKKCRIQSDDCVSDSTV